MNDSQTFSYMPKGNHLTLFKGKKKVHTPNGNVVIAETPELADRLVQLLEQNADHTSCATLLCYHYTYCDLIAKYDVNGVRSDVKTCLQDNLVDDPLLLFHCSTMPASELKPDEVTEEQYTKEYETVLSEFSSHLEGCNMYQLVSVIVLYCSFDSLAFAWRIIQELLPDPSGKEQFITDLKAYCESQESECPEDISEIIDTFLYYYTM